MSRRTESPVGGARAHATVLRILGQHLPGRLLDIPAGAGPVGNDVRGLGYRVVAVDLFPRPGFRGVIADACAPFPFADGSFDAALSMEGIEHFENQTRFLDECARVLCPGGRLLLTTPNVLHLSARVSGFLTGQRLMKQGFINEVTTLRARESGRLYHGHAFLVDVFRLRYMLRVVGLRIDSVHLTRLSTGSLFLAPLVPLIWLATRYALWSGRRRRQRHGRPPAPPAVEREIAALAGSRAVMFSRGLIVVARKEGEAITPVSSV